MISFKYSRKIQPIAPTILKGIRGNWSGTFFEKENINVANIPRPSTSRNTGNIRHKEFTAGVPI